MKNILVPVDFSGLTYTLIDKAALLARAFGSTVRILHVAPPDPAIASSKGWPQEVRDEFAKELQAEHKELRSLANALQEQGIEAKALLARGPRADMILQYARRTETDLIIMGSSRQSALTQLLPHSIVKDMIRKTSCPVLVVPEQGLEGQGENDRQASARGEA